MMLKLKLPAGLQLRPAEPNDFAFAEKLYVASTKPLLKALGTWDEGAVAKRFSDAYHRRPSQVICRNGDEIGWLQVSRNDTSVHLHQIHLVRRCRNLGIGSKLIREVMGLAETLGLPLTLKVIRCNRAVALYGRLGFRVVEEDAELFHMRWDPQEAGEP